VESRVSHSLWLNYVLVVTSLVNVVGVIFALFLFQGNHIPQVTIGVTFLLLKEVPFLVVVFYKSAGVNERSEKLVSMLAISCDNNDEHDVCEQQQQSQSQSRNTTHNTHNMATTTHHTQQRTVLYINASGKRISFPLAGLRLTYQDVGQQLGVWSVAILFSVARSAVGV
jgi:hypothetical protein